MPAFQQPAFANLNVKQIHRNLSEFWNPAYSQEFEPSPSVIEASRYLAGSIDPDNLTLVDD